MKAIIGVVVVVLVIWLAYSVFTPSDTGPIKIGFIGPLSGDAAALGQQMQHVVSYRIKQINAKSGGPQFEVVYEDGKCSGSDAVNAFQKLVDVDGVKIIIGGACSSETLGMAPLANEKKILLVSAVSSNPTIEDQGPYVFSFSYSDKLTAENLAKAVSNYKKVAIITEQNDYNIGIRDVFVETLKQYPNVTLVSNEVFPKGGTDFRGVLEKVRATAPEALVLNPNVGVTAETLLKQLAEIKNWKGYKIYTQFAYLGDSSRSAVGDFAEGMTIIDVPTVTSPDFLALSNAIEGEAGTLKDLGSYYTAALLDDVDVVTSLIAKHGDNPEKVRIELSTGSFKGFIGDISFSGNNFVQFNKAGIYVVENGKAVLQ